MLPEAVTTGSYVRVCDLYAMEAQPGLASPEGARGGGISGRRRRAPKCRRVREAGLNDAPVDDLHHWPPGPSTRRARCRAAAGVPSGRGRAARPGPGAARPGRGPCACWRRVAAGGRVGSAICTVLLSGVVICTLRSGAERAVTRRCRSGGIFLRQHRASRCPGPGGGLFAAEDHGEVEESRPPGLWNGRIRAAPREAAGRLAIGPSSADMEVRGGAERAG